MLDFLDYEKKYLEKQFCNAWVATAVIGSAVIGAATTAYVANKAADTQKEAAQLGSQAQVAATDRGIALSKNMYDTTRADLAPYRDMGVSAGAKLGNRLDEFTAPISIDPNQLENSDYYKFAMTQGQKAVTNSAAARGLGTSGAALKGAATFAKGLATDTYKTAWDMENQNKKNAYDRLKALVDVGGSAAAATGSLGEKSAWQQSQLAMAGGNATQAGLVGGANAEAQGINSIGNAVGRATDNIGGYAMYRGVYGRSPEAAKPFSYDTGTTGGVNPFTGAPSYA